MNTKQMSSRRAIAGIVLTCSVLTLTAAPARSWSNGVDGPDSFGTHDWILRKAINAAGEDADWVKARVALRATDDPDTVDGIDHASGTWWHVYDRWGDEYGGADEAARVWYRRMHRRLEQGRERAASKALGYLAHIVGDVAQPMHTDSSDKEEGIHSSYELAVDDRLDRFRFRYDGEDPAKPGPHTRAVARRAHRSYWALVNAYDANGYTKKVHRITKRRLNRGRTPLRIFSSRPVTGGLLPASGRRNKTRRWVHSRKSRERRPQLLIVGQRG